MSRGASIARSPASAFALYCTRFCCVCAARACSASRATCLASLLRAARRTRTAATDARYLRAGLGANALRRLAAILQRDFLWILDVYHLAVFHTICLGHRVTSK